MLNGVESAHWARRVAGDRVGNRCREGTPKLIWLGKGNFSIAFLNINVQVCMRKWSQIRAINSGNFCEIYAAISPIKNGAGRTGCSIVTPLRAKNRRICMFTPMCLHTYATRVSTRRRSDDERTRYKESTSSIWRTRKDARVRLGQRILGATRYNQFQCGSDNRDFARGLKRELGGLRATRGSA